MIDRKNRLSARGSKCVLLGFLGLFAAELQGDEFRTWTGINGNKIIAECINVEGNLVRLKLDSGREAKVPLSRLSKSDQDFIATLKRTGQAFALKEMPEETQAPRQIEVTGGPRVFLSPHFEFETDQDVSKGFIAEASRVYEGTYLALNSLPHGLTLEPPGGKTHFRGRFMSDSAFNSIASQRMRTIPGQRIVGLYLGEEQELLVPYSSLGAKTLGSRMTLRKSSDTTTLIHEIVHQVMHDWLPLLPTWFSEGMAEYVASVPYQNGRFEFRNAERGLRERLEEQHRITGNAVGQVKPPSSYFPSEDKKKVTSGGETPRDTLAGTVSAPGAATPDGWNGTVKEYRDAMLILYYFMHLDSPDEPGAPVGAYLRMVDAAMENTDRVQKELEEFEKTRVAYNESVKKFNAALDAFRKEADAYNGRVTKHNDQIRQGVPPEERIPVGEPPAEPVPPTDLEVPDIIRQAAAGGSINLVEMVQKSSLPALLRGRDAKELDRLMKSAFAEIGLEISYDR